jgi:hypothetical protein
MKKIVILSALVLSVGTSYNQNENRKSPSQLVEDIIKTQIQLLIEGKEVRKHIQVLEQEHLNNLEIFTKEMGDLTPQLKKCPINSEKYQEINADLKLLKHWYKNSKKHTSAQLQLLEARLQQSPTAQRLKHLLGEKDLLELKIKLHSMQNQQKDQ